MKNSIVIGLIAIMAIATSGLANAVDIVNGWSGNTTIKTIHSEGGDNLFMLNGIGDNCGGNSPWWKLPLDDSTSRKAKLSMLLAAYIAGKTVNLRCENDIVSDFEISD